MPNTVEVPSRAWNVAANGRPDARQSREYAALRRSGAAMIVDRRERARTTLAGSSAAELLTGLVTNDVPSLSRGQGQYAAVLTAKGKIVADVRIFARELDLLVDAPARATSGWWAVVRKFINPRVAKYTDVSEALHDVGVFGIGARALVADVLRVSVDDLSALGMYQHRAAELDGVPVMVARVPDGGVEGYDVFAAPETAARFIARAGERGGTLASAAAFDIARIEAGRPEWGVDMDESTLPQEANLDVLHAISYTKGCYTGQETVARVHFRGHVNRHLNGLRFDPHALLTPGDELVDDAEGKPVGDVRSVAVSPRLGGIALAMVRREIAAGASLTARGPAGTTSVSVLTLPFPA